MPFMLAELPISFERPGWLLLLLLIVPVAWLARRSSAAAGGSVSRGKSIASVAFRAVVIALLAMALAQPSWVKRGRGLTLMMVVDVSQSIPPALKRQTEQYLRDVGGSKTKAEDRIGVVVVAREPDTIAKASELTSVSMPASGVDTTATNLAAGVRRAVSLLPQDTANRILLVSDGNETVESVMAEAELARANGIPIDVLPLEYEHRNEVLFEGITAPTRARVGQSGTLRLTIRAQGRVAGTLYLWRNEEAIDLDPDGAGAGVAVQLEPGPNVVNVPVSFDDPGTQRFRAVFESERGGAAAETGSGTTAAPLVEIDPIEQNNVGVAVTFVGGEGRVLVIHAAESESGPLVAALRRSGLDVLAITADEFTGGLAYLNGFDAVALVDVPRWALNFESDAALHAYVHDLGGGLIMLGGPQSFGAGGWIDSDVAKALPVDLDPPQTRQMPRGALALIMHSCEMPQGNYWGQTIAIAAIDALSRLDYIGIVTFNWAAGGLNGSSWAFPMQLAGDKSAAVSAAKQMAVGDMPDFGSSMQLALQGLMGVNAGQRHAIVISDGDPSAPSNALMRQYIDGGVTITTVMVAGHGTQSDLDKMSAVAQLTGGRFYNVTNPKSLPQIFVKEAQMVARSLILEGDFTPSFGSRLPGPIAGVGSVPPLGGYVLTASRGGLAQTPMFVRTGEADDPLYAYWNYGLGRTVAWTSDATGRWAPAWVGWNGFASFWEETFRWLMRPATPANVSLRTSIEGDTAVVELEATDESGGRVNFLQTEARIIKPDNESAPLALQQVGPGRYRGTFAAGDAGAYLVNVVFAGMTDGVKVSGSVQGAVAVPFPREFRAVRDNTALLKAVAERTGGRVMTAGDPATLNYFDRGDLDVPRSAKRVWDLLAMIAAAIFIFDVAIRRIAIEPDALAALARRLSRPTGAKGEEGVAAWKKARSQAGKRIGAPDGSPGAASDTRSEAKAESQAGPRQGAPRPIDRAVAQRKFDADSAAAPAIDVAGETADGSRDARGRAAGAPGAGSGAGPTAPGAGAASGDAGYTSRLLDAKRRAKSDQPEATPGKGDASEAGPGSGPGSGGATGGGGPGRTDTKGPASEEERRG